MRAVSQRETRLRLLPREHAREELHHARVGVHRRVRARSHRRARTGCAAGACGSRTARSRRAYLAGSHRGMQRSSDTLSVSPPMVTSASPQPVMVTDADLPSNLPPLTVPVSVPDDAQLQLLVQVRLSAVSVDLVARDLVVDLQAARNDLQVGARAAGHDDRRGRARRDVEQRAPAGPASGRAPCRRPCSRSRPRSWSASARRPATSPRACRRRARSA